CCGKGAACRTWACSSRWMGCPDPSWERRQDGWGLVGECGGEVIGAEDRPAGRVAGEGGFTEHGDVADAEAAVAGVPVSDGPLVFGDIDVELFEDELERGVDEVLPVQ